MSAAELFNAVVEVHPDKTGRTIQIPAVADEYNQLMMPLVRYITHLREKGASQSKLSQIREAAKLFAEYSQANTPSNGFGAGQTGNVQVVRHWEHFRSFRAAIVFGTFGKDGTDPSRLYWQASGVNKANRVIKQLTGFFQFLDELDGGSRASRFNPVVSIADHERLWQASNYEYQRAKALLGHTWSKASDQHFESRASEGRQAKKPSLGGVKRIEDFQFNRLLEGGFDRTTENGLRDTLVAILMNKGGLRLSEALHAWVVDFVEDPIEAGTALVKLIHPSQGPCSLTYRGRTYGTRREYLERVYALPDRTELPEKHAQHLGWKSRFSVLRVYWIPPWWGRIFYKLWRSYLQMTSANRANSPYAFIMQSKDDEWVPLTTDAYRKAYERAIYAAGLVPTGQWDMKNSAFTSHANRHAYGDRAKNKCELDPKEVMQALHHASPESQAIYTQKTPAEIMEEINRRCDAMKVGLGSLPKGISSASERERARASESSSAFANGVWSLPDSFRELLADDNF